MAIVCAVIFLFGQVAQAAVAPVRQQVEHARELVKSGNTPEALRQLREMLDSHPGDPEALFEAGELFQDLAGMTFERIERIAPDSAETHELLGKYYDARGQLSQALSEYKLALEKNANAPGLHFLVGNVHWKNRDFDAALPELEHELRINPGHSMANQRIGNIYIARDETAKAIQYLEKAVLGDPASLEAHRDLGKAYRQVGRLTDALAQFKIVAESRPDDDSVHAQLATVYRAMGDASKAAQELKQHRELLEKRAEAARKKD